MERPCRQLLGNAEAAVAGGDMSVAMASMHMLWRCSLRSDSTLKQYCANWVERVSEKLPAAPAITN
jgi:hypothetical protein